MMDKVIKSIVEDDFKVEILSYLYNKNYIELQDIIPKFNNILAQKGNRNYLTGPGRDIAAG